MSENLSSSRLPLATGSQTLQTHRLGQSGFSLVELIIVIVLTGILAGAMLNLMAGPTRAYVEAGRRAGLVDVAETALLRMTRELRLALPNSIRVSSAGSVTAVEFLRIREGARYRAWPTSGGLPGCGATGGLGDPLEFGCADAGFDVLGQLARRAQVDTGASCTTGNGDCVVIFNTGQTGASAYNADNLATVTAASDNSADDGSDQLSVTNASLIGGNPAFPLASPQQRFYIVDTPVSFVCDTASGQLNRHQDYNIAAAQSTAPGGSTALLVNQVSACAFTYQAGTESRGGMVTLRLSLQEPVLGETVSLIQQAHVSNVP